MQSIIVNAFFILNGSVQRISRGFYPRQRPPALEPPPPPPPPPENPPPLPDPEEDLLAAVIAELRESSMALTM